MNKTQYKQVEKWLSQVDNHDAKRITDTASWYKGRIDGEDLFVIYSTEETDPTILYERKDAQRMSELDILLDLLEDDEYGKSINGKPSFTQRVSQGSWMQNVNNSKNNLGNLGSGQNNQNAGVLQSQSQRNGSPAFWSIFKNLFDIQASRESSNKDGTNGSIIRSLKYPNISILTEAQQKYFKFSKVRDKKIVFNDIKRV